MIHLKMTQTFTCQIITLYIKRQNKKGGGICVFIKDTLLYKIVDDLSVSNGDNETLAIEIINKKSKNILP